MPHRSTSARQAWVSLPCPRRSHWRKTGLSRRRRIKPSQAGNQSNQAESNQKSGSMNKTQGPTSNIQRNAKGQCSLPGMWSFSGAWKLEFGFFTLILVPEYLTQYITRTTASTIERSLPLIAAHCHILPYIAIYCHILPAIPRNAFQALFSTKNLKLLDKSAKSTSKSTFKKLQFSRAKLSTLNSPNPQPFNSLPYSTHDARRPHFLIHRCLTWPASLIVFLFYDNRSSQRN